MTEIKVGQVGWFWCYHLGKSWKVLDRIKNIDPKDTHPYHTYQDSYYEHFQPATDEELADLGLVRKEKLDIAVKALEEYMIFCRHPAQEALAKIKEIK